MTDFTGTTVQESYSIFSIFYRIKTFFSNLWDRVFPKESNLVKHGKVEFAATGYDLNQKEENPNKWICENVLELLMVFSKQGHSGSSAPYCVNYFKKLALFEPLCPLTGKDNEWTEVMNGTWQNKRCSHVFKEADGKTYDSHGKIFREPNGCCYQNFASRVFIEFPYTPKTEYVSVPAAEVAGI